VIGVIMLGAMSDTVVWRAGRLLWLLGDHLSFDCRLRPADASRKGHAAAIAAESQWVRPHPACPAGVLLP
jgi:hypothetical protein